MRPRGKEAWVFYILSQFKSVYFMIVFMTEQRLSLGPHVPVGETILNPLDQEI